MTIYVLDVSYMHGLDELDDSECILGETIWLNKSAFRACTTNLFWMQNYYRYLQKLIGKYVHLDTYEYHVETSYDDKDEDPPSDIVSSIASSMFWRDVNDGAETAKISPLISYSFNNDDNGELFVIPEVVNDIYVDTVLACSDPEMDYIDKIALLFTNLDKYIVDLAEDPDILTLRKTILNILPELLLDFYAYDARYSMDPVYMEKLWYDSLSFISR